MEKKRNKVPKCYKFNAWLCEQLKETTKELDVKETYFVEMAIIEKLNRIQLKKEKEEE